MFNNCLKNINSYRAYNQQFKTNPTAYKSFRLVLLKPKTYLSKIKQATNYIFNSAFLFLQLPSCKYVGV